MRSPATAVILASLLLIASPSGAPPELIKNGGLDAGPADWGNTGNGTGIRFSCAPPPRAAKGNALLIEKEKPDQNPSNWFQKVELPKEKPKRLELKARVMADTLQAANACVMVQIWDAEGKMSGGAWTEAVSENTEWRAVSAVFDVPAKTASLRVLAYLVGAGRVWFDDFSLAPTTKDLKTSSGTAPSPYERLARKCASEISWVFDAAEAKRRAAAEKKPILVYIRCIDDEKAWPSAQKTLAAEDVRWTDDGLRKDVLMRAGPLSDPDVQALISKRFVPLVLTYVLSLHGNSTLSGVDPLACVGLESMQVVTPAFAVLGPDGSLIHLFHRIGILSGPLVDGVLRHSLEKAKVPRFASQDPAELFAAGELQGTAAAIAGRNDDASRLLRARVLRRGGDMKGALDALEGMSSAEARLERGRTLLAEEKKTEARTELAAASAILKGDRTAEACFWAAWCAFEALECDEARKSLGALVGESLFGRKSAAMLLPSGPRLLLSETPAYIRAPTALPAQTEVLDPAKPWDSSHSIALLLALQRPDGSFGGHDGAEGFGSWDPAISALAGDALLAWRAKMPLEQQKAADGALAKVRRYLEAWAARPLNPNLGAFDHPYALMHLVRVGAKETAAKVIASIAASQQADENWTVYQAARPASFNTALNVMALAKAKAAGLEVPKDLIESGAKALEAMRTSAGLFPYSTMTGHEWMTTPHGSIARDALCEHALLLAGRKRKPAIEAALDRFLQYESELRAPTKKLYDYFNARGHGGYYFFFAHHNAREAALLLPQEKRAKVLGTISAEVLAAREVDGSWMDHYMIGRAYGTAMALLILADP